MQPPAKPSSAPAEPSPNPPEPEAFDSELIHDAAHVADELAEPVLHRPWRRRLRTVMKLAVGTALVGLVGWALWRQLVAADFEGVAFNWPAAAAACVVLFGLYGSLLASQRMLLRAFTGVRMPWGAMMAAAWVPLAGKYIPGKFAAVAGAVYLLRRAGVPVAAALSVFVVLDAMPLLSGAVLSTAVLLDPDVRQALPGLNATTAALLFGATFAAVLVAISPAVFGRLIDGALRLLRRPPLPHRPRWRDYAGPAAWSLGQWASNSLALWLMCHAFAPPGAGPALADFPVIVGVTAVTMCLSYFSAFITPGGAGAREGVLWGLLTATLGGQMPPAAIAAVTVAMRLAHTLVEMLLCGVGLLALRRLGSVKGTAQENARPPEAGH